MATLRVTRYHSSLARQAARGCYLYLFFSPLLTLPLGAGALLDPTLAPAEAWQRFLLAGAFNLVPACLILVPNRWVSAHAAQATVLGLLRWLIPCLVYTQPRLLLAVASQIVDWPLVAQLGTPQFLAAALLTWPAGVLLWLGGSQLGLWQAERGATWLWSIGRVRQ